MTVSDIEAAELLLSVSPLFKPVHIPKFGIPRTEAPLLNPQKSHPDLGKTRDRSWSLETLVEVAMLSQSFANEPNAKNNSSYSANGLPLGSPNKNKSLNIRVPDLSSYLEKHSRRALKSETQPFGKPTEILYPSNLPTKLQEVYFKQGRIGVYTRAQRKELLDRFSRKRARRVWFKKIRYGCRKNLASQRIRIKGRFVKTTEKLRVESA